MSAAAALDQAIKAVCPIDGVSIGRWDDRTTWRIDFRPEASAGQRAAAADVVAQFDPLTAPTPQSPLEKVADLMVSKGILTQAQVDEALTP